jgi:hypothetical protein
MYVEDPTAINLAELIPVFHRWIQNDRVEGALIDVADYEHVHHGPGVMLVAHEGDYRLDSGEGRPGLYYVRKRDTGEDWRNGVRSVFRCLLKACQELEQEKSLSRGIRFRTDEIRLAILDRLRAPNTQETLHALSDGLDAVLGDIYADATLQIEPANRDPRDGFSVRVQVDPAPSLAAMIDRVCSDVSSSVG